MFSRFFAFLFLLFPLLGAQAKDLSVQIDYDTTSTGTDGVTRITRYSDQLIRRDNDSWQVRRMPAGVHHEAEHSAAEKGHKHLDVGTAARWVTRTQDGKLEVHLVNTHDKVVVDVPKTEYSNIGFDGDWANASQLIGTDQVRKMKVTGKSAPAGSRWYESKKGQTTIRILWDELQEFPRKIESFNASGLYRSTVTVTPQAMPDRMPWTQLQGYSRKEYADFLD